MEEKYCKLCWKRFVNGRALGGHMRSHMLHHPLPSQVDPHPESASSLMADPGFALQDRESETESSKKPTRKRSRLTRRRSIYVSLRHQEPEEEGNSETAEEIKTMKVGPRTSQQLLSESCTEQEPKSSVSDAARTAEEDLAFSLVLLSRDKWGKEKEEESDDRIRWEKKRKWFECETCEKVFKSYQALGGHRASHKKKRALEGSSYSSSSSSVILLVSDEKKKKKKKRSSGHECPICLKVCSSGQALGGHKRSHATGSENNSLVKRGIINLIDLNLPAPSEDEDLVS
ncbi:hypothetical protein EUTSA_v10009894mg [Eutrema salsugineum]|uniref:C2H2-type domain-containing protein n=1 Tax=Eutrema salsugineum TaxID=72664 RepID=V4LAN6_EUTSA|nr:zinc finger protein ZAT1 [Eutrema salsugineum]ESQ36833.1 hypothetical protein EUTSA_v10009894mg [Eutrema salsugineum]